MKNFNLEYTDKQMEEEHSTIKQKHCLENRQVVFYFTVAYLLLPSIEAIVTQNFIDLISPGVALCILLLIRVWNRIRNGCAPVFTSLVALIFNFSLFFLRTSNYSYLPKNRAFLQGYLFASLQITFLSRFPKLLSKITAVVVAYILRFLVMGLLDTELIDAYIILQNLWVDCFVLYICYTNEKRERMIFKNFYEYREEFTKFKELLADYLPHCIIVIDESTGKVPLFTNKAFETQFNQSQTQLKVTESSSYNTKTKSKIDMSSLQVKKETIREIDTQQCYSELFNTAVYLVEVIEEIRIQKSLDQKTISLSALFTNRGHNMCFDVILKKMKWDNEKAIVVILSDTTYQENLNALRIASANKDQVIATISHELRTPLNGIIGILAMAEKKVDDCEVKEYLGLCKDNAHLLLSLVNSILDLQQIRQGKFRLNPIGIDIRRLLRDIMNLFQFQCINKHIYLKLEIDENVPDCIYTDENRLKQILINLIGNAIKFTFKGGITLGIFRDPKEKEYLELFVADTGIGIKEEDQSKLFKMYGKLDDKAEANRNGVGLGLMISNTLAEILSVKKMEGIRVSSKLGEGSRFSFRVLKDITDYKTNFTFTEDAQHEEEQIAEENKLDQSEVSSKIFAYTMTSKAAKSLHNRFPISRFQSENLLQISSFEISQEIKKDKSICKHSDAFGTNRTYKQELEENLSMSGKDSHHILVVDDNPFNLLVAENIICGLGHKFIRANSGQEAIEVFSKPKKKNHELPDVVLMDCQMPIMDGYETTELLIKIVTENKMKRVPIIALTANNSDEDIRRCYESGMINHIPKPLFSEALSKALSRINN